VARAAEAKAAQTWIALLRAINLGSRNRIAMGELRRVFAETGCDDVRTYIASGNVVFTGAWADPHKLARRLERAVAEACGVHSTVILRTADELARLVRAKPFDDDASRTHVTFLAEKPERARVEALKRLDVAPDRFRVRGADVVLHYPNGVQGSRLTAALLERELGVAGTNRTWKTVAKLAELAGSG